MKTVLIVEEEAVVRRLIRQILEEGGYRIIESQDGTEALSLFQQQNYKIDLLLTNIEIPGINGCRLAESMEIIYPHLQVLFISGYPYEVIMHHKGIIKDINFLQKPFAIDELLRKVQRLLGI